MKAKVKDQGHQVHLLGLFHLAFSTIYVLPQKSYGSRSRVTLVKVKSNRFQQRQVGLHQHKVVSFIFKTKRVS